MKSFFSISAVAIIAAIFFVGTTSTNINLDNRLDYIYDNYKNNDPGNAYSIHNFPASKGENLEIRTSGGSISVKGADVDEAEVRMFVRKRNRYLTPDDTDLSNFEIEITKRGNTIIAKANRKSSMNTILNVNNESISFEVLVPSSFNVDVNTSGGSISLDELDGNLNGSTSGGSISLNNLGGVVDVRTSGGSISINESGGTIIARTSGGSVTAKNSAGKIELKTSGGSMNLDNICGEVDASTSGGSIKANILKLEGDLSLRTSGGSISASLPSDLGLDLDLKGNSVVVQLQNFTGETKRSSVSGSMNGGGHNVSMRTSGGTVRLNWAD
ncbi:MAG TPA: hypothetical protein DCE78_09120 [Bacteroidetes bacterium]|nr:hypothetical protein [Bacteroidota bacterium]